MCEAAVLGYFFQIGSNVSQQCDHLRILREKLWSILTFVTIFLIIFHVALGCVV